MTGEQMPYSMASDEAVTVFLLLSFFLISYAVGRGRKHIQQHLKMLFLGKDRASFFDEPTGSETRYVAALTMVTSLLVGICLFGYMRQQCQGTVEPLRGGLLLSAYSAAVLVYLLVKSGFYSLVNWVFFEKEQRTSWARTFFDVCGFSSFVLFPIVLLAVYHGINHIIVEWICALFLVFVKILLFYKCVKNFFKHFGSWFHLILYFCTLEIVPLFLLSEAVGAMNSILVIKI